MLDSLLEASTEELLHTDLPDLMLLFIIAMAIYLCNFTISVEI